MSERYSRLYRLPANQDSGDSPVIVAAGALLRDNETNTVLAQLKLQNITYKIVTSVTVSVIPLDGAGLPSGDSVEHTYKNLAADEDAYFGDREPIPFENPDTKKFSVTVEEVVFYDNSFWPGMGFISDELPPLGEEGQEAAEETAETSEPGELSGEPETEEPEAAEAEPETEEPETEEPKMTEARSETEEIGESLVEAETADSETEAPAAEEGPESAGNAVQEAADQVSDNESAPDADDIKADEYGQEVSEPESEAEEPDDAVNAAEEDEPPVLAGETPKPAEPKTADYELTAQDILELTSPETETPQKEKGEKKKKNNIIVYAILAVVIIAVVVIACGVQLGWFGDDEEIVAEVTTAAEDGTEEGTESETGEESETAVATGTEDEMTMEDYTTIEVAQSVVDAVDDDLVQDAIDTMLSSYAASETVTEGTVEEGDEIYISYVGTLDGEEFDGGSSDGTTITVGSSGYIDGFDDGLIGVEIGDTVDLYLTFPDDYSAEELAGQDVVFSVTVQYKTETYTPDLTDDFVSTYSEEYWYEQLDTVDDLYDYVYNYYYEYYLYSAMLEALQEKQTVITYNQENYDLLYEYAYEELSYYASYYSTDADTFAAYYGYESAEDYANDEAVYYADLIILFDYLWEDLGLEDYTDEDIDSALEEYIEKRGYADYYTLEEFKEASGDTWLLIYEGIEFKYYTIMDALADRVVFTED